MGTWLGKARVRTLLAMTGVTMAVLTGCEPTVRETVITGVGSATDGLASTFVTALFQYLLGSEVTADIPVI